MRTVALSSPGLDRGGRTPRPLAFRAVALPRSPAPAGVRWLGDAGRMPSEPTSYPGYRFPAEVIHHATWLYHVFSLSQRDIELILAEPGVVVSPASTWPELLHSLATHRTSGLGEERDPVGLLPFGEVHALEGAERGEPHRRETRERDEAGAQEGRPDARNMAIMTCENRVRRD